ncbi:FecR domain-containing protein [Algoriphagus halophilus]|uniref:FecR family protein n=1 Tax=Algoriphagus halophilus TaxID=226505 RepID=UPI00358EC0C3
MISIPEDKKVKWQVQVNELFIEDIGTVFNVKAYPTNPLIEVSVLEGEVRMYLQSKEGIQLLAGEKGIFDKNSGSFSKEETDANVDSYSTKSFSYLNQELAFVVAQLSEVYQTEIVLEGNIGGCRLTVDFENEELDTILSIISETLNLDITRNGSDIVLSGAACN